MKSKNRRSRRVMKVLGNRSRRVEVFLLPREKERKPKIFSRFTFWVGGERKSASVLGKTFGRSEGCFSHVPVLYVKL
jgi:hypothetical protein